MKNLKALSDAATEGQWGLYNEGRTLEIGFPDKPGQRPCIVGWPGFDSTDLSMKENRANAAFIVALVNAYRAGDLTARPEAATKNRDEIIEECALLCEGFQIHYSQLQYPENERTAWTLAQQIREMKTGGARATRSPLAPKEKP